MPERSTGPTESRSRDAVSPAAPGDAVAPAASAGAGATEPTTPAGAGAARPSPAGGDAAQPSAPARGEAAERPMPAPAATEPIELGGEPFRLTDPAPDSPAYPYPGDSADGDEPPTGGSARTRRIVLNTLLAVGLAGAAVLGYTAWRIGTQKDATLTAPAQVAGLRMDNTENGRSTAEYLATAISADVDLDQTVGAVYTDPAAADRSVLFFGGTTLIWTPESDLDTAFNLISDDQGSVSGLHQVGAGDLGGTMKCGTTSTGDGDITVCGWADHGSLALAMFPNRDEAESADLLRQIRSAAQTRA